MKHRQQPRNLTWSILFALLFLLSQDFLFWNGEIHTGPWGFPLRVFYFLLLQGLLVALLVGFLAGRSGNDDPGPD
ncbi:MAG: hypothetical protein OEU91_02095 [Gammaproteobacteria bacterium]|nr:hypothetical protein [Gammaproteobacteria bacterium]